MMRQSNIVTLTKAIGIILMVLAHAMPPEHIVWRVIYTFHMPLFFIMSGYCFKEKYLEDAKQFVIRKLKGIYVPFVAFSLVFLALHNVFCKLYIYEPMSLYGWKDFAWQTSRIVTRMSHNEGLLGTFWFLKELFWGNLIFYCILKIFKGKEMSVTFCLLILAVVLAITHLRIPYFNVTSTSVLAAFFIAFGYWWKKADWHINKWMLWIVGTLSIAIELFLVHRTGFVGLSASRVLLFILPAIAGTMMVFELCRLLVIYVQKIVLIPIEFIGQHTLPIMALHFVSFKFVTLSIIKNNHLSIERLSDFPVLYDYANARGWVILYTFAGICIPLMCVWVWEWSTEKVTDKNCKTKKK